jgi:hypothetical protein
MESRHRANGWPWAAMAPPAEQDMPSASVGGGEEGCKTVGSGGIESNQEESGTVGFVVDGRIESWCPPLGGLIWAVGGV